MDFSFSTSKAIHFGNGVSRSCAALLPEMVKRVAVITGSDPDRHKQILNSITSRNIEVQAFETKCESTVETIMETVEGALLFQPDCVGDGSVIDTGKAVAALLAKEGALTDYLEVVGKGKPLTHPSVPYMAIPTTAGTGSEVTHNSVIGVPEEELKVSLRSSSMIPDWAIVDPELTYDLPRSIAAFTGMDAFIQCFEAYLSCAANPITDGIALEGVRRAAKALRSACEESLKKAAKSNMCIGKPMRRHGVGECKAWRSARICRSHRWHDRCAPWSALRQPPASCSSNEFRYRHPARSKRYHSPKIQRARRRSYRQSLRYRQLCHRLDRIPHKGASSPLFERTRIQSLPNF